jgi:hypothetical protein
MQPSKFGIVKHHPLDIFTDQKVLHFSFFRSAVLL